MADTASPTASPPAPAQTPPEHRDFAEALHTKYVAKDGHAAEKRKILIIPAMLLAGGVVLGGTARMLLSPAWATAVTGTLTLLIVAFAVLAVCAVFRADPLRGVDWGTAGDYEQKLTAGLHPDARVVLARARQEIGRRFPAADRVHVYSPDRLPDHHCTLEATGCDCARMRFNAALLPNRRHPIIIVGDRLLDQPAALAYALAHETNHVRRPWPQVLILRQLVNVAGWLGMGLVLPVRTLAIAAPTVWLATMLLSWIDELAADIAARTTGQAAARTYWRMRRTARPTPTGLSRLTKPITAVLTPTHPPMALRAALARAHQGPGQR